MDQVMSSILGSALQGYFDIFFKNFKKEDFQLNLTGMGVAESKTTLHNLEIKEEIVQEVLGTPNFEVGQVKINTLSITVAPTKINKVPIVITIDRIECILTEPFTKLKTIPTVLEAFFKAKMGKDGKTSYGFAEKIIDGITINVNNIHAEIITRGKYKTEEDGHWTPPRLICDIEGLSIVTTNDKWEVVELSRARDYNNDRNEVFVFKELTIQSINTAMVTPKAVVPLLTRLPVTVNIVIKKGLDNQLQALSAEVKLRKFQVLFNMEHLTTLISMLEGINACMYRKDSPDPPKVPSPLIIVANITLREWSIVATEPTGNGVEIYGSNLHVGIGSDNPSEKQVELVVPDFFVRQYSARRGPEKHNLVEPHFGLPFKDPALLIPPLPSTLHPDYVAQERPPPVFYMKGTFRNLAQRPAFDKEMQVIVNPVKAVVRAEDVEQLVEFVTHCAPYLNQIRTLADNKPPPEIAERVLFQDPHSTLEEFISLKLEMSIFSLVLPSAEGAKYAKLTLNVKDTSLLMHPQLPVNETFAQGICASPNFPSGPADMAFSRAQVQARAIHTVKVKVLTKLDFTVQSAPEAEPECVLELPRTGLDFEISLGDSQELQPLSERSLGPKPLEIKLLQGSLNAAQAYGRLTQHQYRTVLRRIDQVLPLLPLVQRVRLFSGSVQQPTTPLVFLLKLDRGECCLCNDYTTGDEKPSVEGVAMELLAGLAFDGLELCFENSASRRIVKGSLRSLELNALPNPPIPSKLYHPNAFISTLPQEGPLLALRVVYVSYPGPTEQLVAEGEADGVLDQALGKVTKVFRSSAFHEGERSSAAVQICGLRSGLNPNPAAKIVSFFLKADRTLGDMARTLKKAKQALENIDFRSVASDLSKIELDVDIDLAVDIRDTKVFLTRDFEPDRPSSHGNVELGIGRINVGRKAENKYKQISGVHVEAVSLQCNKDLPGQGVVSDGVFEPISFKLGASTEWSPEQKKWLIQSSGGLDRVALDIKPSHSDVFVDMLRGLKMKYVREIVDNLTKFLERKPEDEQAEAEPAQDFGNPLDDKLKELHAWIERTHAHNEQAKAEKAVLAQSIKNLELASGQVDIISTAKKVGALHRSHGNKWVRYYGVLGEGSLYLLENEQTKRLITRVTIGAQTALEMVNNIPNCFQVSAEEVVTIRVEDEMAMMQWVNELLRVQCGAAQASSSGSSRPPDAHDHVSQDIAALAQISNSLQEMAKELGSQASLLARIRALEGQIKQKDATIAKLSAGV